MNDDKKKKVKRSETFFIPSAEFLTKLNNMGYVVKGNVLINFRSLQKIRGEFRLTPAGDLTTMFETIMVWVFVSRSHRAKHGTPRGTFLGLPGMSFLPFFPRFENIFIKSGYFYLFFKKEEKGEKRKSKRFMFNVLFNSV